MYVPSLQSDLVLTQSGHPLGSSSRFSQQALEELDEDEEELQEEEEEPDFWQQDRLQFSASKALPEQPLGLDLTQAGQSLANSALSTASQQELELLV
jgi:hypothetical protein